VFTDVQQNGSTMILNILNKDEIIAQCEFEATDIPLGKVVDRWFPLQVPSKPFRTAGRIRLILHLIENVSSFFFLLLLDQLLILILKTFQFSCKL
jgi:hypothetical protein